MALSSKRDIALWVWERELGEPYLWGGNDPLAGFDCSGFVIEGLKSAGVLSRMGDWTAAQLAAMFPVVASPEVGCLLFWNRGSSIGHVEVVWAKVDGQLFTIGASGGGSSTLDRANAIAQDAYVKIRPAEPSWVRCVNPFGAK